MLADIVGGITVDQKRSTEDCESVPYLRVANVQCGYLDLSEVKPISAPRDRVEQLRLRPGDILFNEGGDIDKLGRGWIWEGQLPNCIHQNHVFRARLFVAYALNKIISWYGNVLGRTLFMRLGKQTTNLASLSLTKLKSFPVPVMCPREADEIVSRVDDILSVTDHQASEIEKQMRGSSSLRQGVLKAAFSGQLVNQDPTDEPAAALLERIAAERGMDNAAPKRGRKKKATA
jgi:type I restriction enzyme S subunit